MNVLVISSNPWSDTNAFGNTVSNFFSTWDKDEFYSIYSRAGSPSNSICKKYYRITDASILKNFFRKEKIGSYVKYEEYPCSADNSSKAAQEKAFIHFLHKNNIKIFHSIERFLWKGKRWNNKKFNTFLEEAKPDVIFSFGVANQAVFELIKACKEKTNAKTVLFIADDVYGQYCKNSKGRKNKIKFEKMIADADLIYGASEQLSYEYQNIFNKKIKPLYKSCEFTHPVSKKENRVIKILYAGNLLYGRAETLSSLADAIERINVDGVKISLEIYSNTALDDELMSKLSRGQSSQLCGSRPYNEIKEKMRSADIVLHVESFEESEKFKVRYSFSTKIIDCLQSGSVFMAIGPDGIASVEYPKGIDGAIVINNTDEIESVLRASVLDADLHEKALKIREFAMAHHNKEKISNDLKQDFKELLNGDSIN